MNPSIPLFPQPVIILVQPQLSENMGSTARAMLNFGLNHLRLVDPQQSWTNKPARSMAAGAYDILERAQVYSSTEEAIADLQAVYATTARPRDMIKPITTPREAAKELVSKAQQGLHSGLLFGREKSGLTNHDVALVEKVIEIPVNPDFSSLNLSQAVIVTAYEWYQEVTQTPCPTLRHTNTLPATMEELLNFLTRLEKELDKNGFLAIPGKRDIMIRNIRNIFTRSHLTDQEVRTLHGIISSLILYSDKSERDL